MKSAKKAIAGLFSSLLVLTGPAGAATVTIDGTQTYQTIDGFGVNANHRSWTNNELQPVLDALIDQAGMTLFRVVYDKLGLGNRQRKQRPDPDELDLLQHGLQHAGISGTLGDYGLS